MELTIAWVAVPARPRWPSASAAGWRSSGSSRFRFPGALVPAVGFAAIVVVAQVPTLWDATAELTVPIVVALAIAGLALSWRRWRRPGPWAVAARDRRLRGLRGADRALRPGDLRRLHQARRHRHLDGAHRPGHGARPQPRRPRAVDLRGDPRRSTSATGYPVGVFLPLGVARALVGQDVAWLIQPYMAFGGGLLGPGAVAARRADRPPARRCARRSSLPRRALGASVRLLPVGRHQGGRRRARSSQAAAGLAGFAIRERCAPRALIPLGARRRRPDRGAERRRGDLAAGGRWLPAAGVRGARARGARHGADRRRLRDRRRAPRACRSSRPAASCRPPPRRSAARPRSATSSIR